MKECLLASQNRLLPHEINQETEYLRVHPSANGKYCSHPSQFLQSTTKAIQYLFEMLRAAFIFFILFVAFFFLEYNYCRLFIQELPLKEDNTSRELRQKNLLLSSAQNRRFHYSKKAALSFVRRRKPHILYSPKETPYFAVPLNDEFAYRHIFKNGGTTVQNQVGTSKHVDSGSIGKRKLIATVRDPIEHFLSGWAECGERLKERWLPNRDNLSLDERIGSWLDYIQFCPTCHCVAHSLPQANFLLHYDNESHAFNFDPRVDIVGHLHELPDLFNFVGLSYDYSIPPAKVFKDDEKKSRMFPRDINLLSKTTIKRLCSFLVLDYYVFDFEPPQSCKAEIRKDMSAMMKEKFIY